MNKRSPNPFRGLLYGAIAGVTAAWAMNQFQTLLMKITELQSHRHGVSHESANSNGETKETSEDATMKTADRLARSINFRPLSQEEKAKAGPLVHYIFGTAMGALYGITSEYVPEARAGFGTIFGTLLFAVADEIAVPLLGLSGPPAETPAAGHIRAFASHIVYGASTEAVRATLSRAA